MSDIMNLFNKLIFTAREAGASDIHISAGQPVMLRVCGELIKPAIPALDESAEDILLNILSDKQKNAFDGGCDLDFALQTADGSRLRVNIFRQQGRISGCIRLFESYIPDIKALALPSVLETLSDQQRGLILITGPTGCGKSTTLAAMIDRINNCRSSHIITIEDPVEYIYRPKLSLIHQREIGHDTAGFSSAIRSALREDVDIILVGEMRDYETISAVLTAAETGHLVMSTLHTFSAPLTINRIIDACPSHAQNQIRTQLAGVLKGCVAQCLIPAVGGGRIAGTEVLTVTDAVSNMIRDNKIHQIPSVMQSGAKDGMHTLNTDLLRLLKAGRITRENALKYTNNRKELEELLLS